MQHLYQKRHCMDQDIGNWESFLTPLGSSIQLIDDWSCIFNISDPGLQISDSYWDIFARKLFIACHFVYKVPMVALKLTRSYELFAPYVAIVQITHVYFVIVDITDVAGSIFMAPPRPQCFQVAIMLESNGAMMGFDPNHSLAFLSFTGSCISSKTEVKY